MPPALHCYTTLSACDLPLCQWCRGWGLDPSQTSGTLLYTQKPGSASFHAPCGCMRIAIFMVTEVTHIELIELRALLFIPQTLWFRHPTAWEKEHARSCAVRLFAKLALTTPATPVGTPLCRVPWLSHQEVEFFSAVWIWADFVT